MEKTHIPVEIKCERPKLEVGKKYELHIFDLHSYDGYTNDNECINTLHITYQGGDIAQYFMRKAKRYAESRFDVMSFLGEYKYKLVHPRDSSTHCGGFYDMVLECESEKTLVGLGTLETKDEPSTHAAIAVNIWEYKEPKFENV